MTSFQSYSKPQITLEVTSHDEDKGGITFEVLSFKVRVYL